jgi:hypothetical protein
LVEVEVAVVAWAGTQEYLNSKTLLLMLMVVWTGASVRVNKHHKEIKEHEVAWEVRVEAVVVSLEWVEDEDEE